MSFDRRFARPTAGAAGAAGPGGPGGRRPVRASGLAAPGLGERRPASGPTPRRFKSRVPVKRRSKLLALVGNFLAALLLVGVPAAGITWLVTSPGFAVTQVEIDVGEGDRVGEAWLAERLAPLEGENLLWLSLERIEARVAGHPWVAGVEATKLPPDRLRVAVVERRAAALLDDGDGDRLWLDATGRPIAPAGQHEEVGAGILRLAWDGERPPSAAGRRAALAGALETADALASARPDWGRGMERITVLGEEDFRVTGTALPRPLGALVVGPGSFGPRLAILDQLLPELEARGPDPAEVDLRFSHRIIVRPAQGPKEGEPYGTT